MTLDLWGNVQSCSNYRGIMFMSHTMELWGKVFEARLRREVMIIEQQYDDEKVLSNGTFAFKVLMENYRDGQKEFH